MRIAILLLPALFVTACASVDTTPSAALIAGAPGELTSSEGLRAKARFRVDAPAVRAARKYNAGIAEIQWDGRRGEVVLELKERGRAGIPVPVQEAREDDVALVLHTSGTTGKPKAVSSNPS